MQSDSAKQFTFFVIASYFVTIVLFSGSPEAILLDLLRIAPVLVLAYVLSRMAQPPARPANETPHAIHRVTVEHADGHVVQQFVFEKDLLTYQTAVHDLYNRAAQHET